MKAMIITGTGEKAFCAGADIKFLNQASPLEVRELARMAVSVNNKIETLGKVVVAAINGYALGGGLELAESCVLRVVIRPASPIILQVMQDIFICLHATEWKMLEPHLPPVPSSAPAPAGFGRANALRALRSDHRGRVVRSCGFRREPTSLTVRLGPFVYSAFRCWAS